MHKNDKAQLVPVHLARDALLEWANVLTAVEPGKFDMNYYASRCGTKACVFGWGTAVPVIAEHGWKLKRDGFDYQGCTPDGNSKTTSYDLAHKAFSLVDSSEWYRLFFDTSYKRDAILKLREFAHRYIE